MTKTPIRPKWTCQECGNNAMFVFDGTAYVSSLSAWVEHEAAYRRLAMVEVKPTLEEHPSTCWVCGSDQIKETEDSDGTVTEQGTRPAAQEGR